METQIEQQRPGRKSPKVRALLDNIARVVPTDLPTPTATSSTPNASQEDRTPNAASAAELRGAAILALSYYMCRRLVRVTSPAELDDFIEDTLDDDEWVRLRRRLRDLYSVETTMSSVVGGPSRPPDYLLDLADSDTRIVDLLLFAQRVEFECSVAALRWVAELAEQSAAAGEFLPAEREPPDDSSPVWFLAERTIPLEWREAFLARTKADIAQEALFAMAVAKKTEHTAPPPKGMVARLVKIWVDGARAYLTALASLPGVKPMNPALVDPDKVQRIKQSFELEEVAERGYQERLKAARAAGGTYPKPDLEDD